jgi:signal peptidase II
MSTRRVTALILICIAVVAADQFTKYLVARRLDLNSPLDLVGNVLRFTHIRNPNAAFGVSFGPRAPLLPIALLAICILLIAFYKAGAKGKTGLIGLGLILGGAFGNLIDRLRFGEVVDFVDVGVGRFRWPVFNVADSCVTIGVILLILASLSLRRCKAPVVCPGQQTKLPQDS